MPIKTFLLGAILTLSALASAAEDEVAYSGIWQDVNHGSDFYVIQESDVELVLVALPGVEASGDTLSYSYIGSKEDLVLTRLSETSPIKDIFEVVRLTFTSDDTATILPVCDACNAVLIELIKVF